jgi:hypothetical protein
MSSSQFIAQSFSLNMKDSYKIDTSGYFATGVDLYFEQKDPNFPVTVEIREIDPTSNLLTNKYLPFSRIYYQSNNINTSTDGSKPTPFLFEAPVYLLDNREYAIVVTPGGGSPNYRVWTSRLGGEDKVTKNKITKQPSLGMLYASGVAVPEEDLKFRLFIADFDISTSGKIVVKNETKDYLTIANSAGGKLNIAGESVHGQTRIVGSFANTVTMSSAKLANGSLYVQGFVSGAKGTLTEFNGSYLVVKDVTTAVKFKGAERVRIRTNVGSGGFSLGTGTIVGNSSGVITSTITPVGTVSYYDEVNSANVYLHIANCSYVNSGSVAACTYNRLFTANTYVKGQLNGYTARIVSINNLEYNLVNFQSRFLLPSNTTVYGEGKFATSTSARDSSFIRINVNDDTEFDAPRYILSRSNESNTSSSSSSFAVNKSTEIQYILTSNNRFASPAFDLRQISGTTVLNLLNSNTDIGSSEDYVAAGGNAKSRYITRKVSLLDGQDAEDLRVYLTAYKPSGSDILVYYKILNSEDNDTFEQARWIPMNRVTTQGFASDAIYSSSSKKNDFLELVYDVPPYSATNKSGYLDTNSNIIEYRNSAGARFIKYKHFAIKIVLVNQNSSNPPRVKDLRALALMR